MLRPAHRAAAPLWRRGSSSSRRPYRNWHHRPYSDSAVAVGVEGSSNPPSSPPPPPPPPQDSYYAPLAAAGRRPPLLLDVGSSEAFRSGHVKDAVSFPLADLAARSYELPPPYEAPLSIGGPSPTDVRIAVDILQAAGWRCRVAYQDHGADRDMYLLKRGKGGVVAALEEGDSDSPLLPHLRPNPFLQMVSDDIIDWRDAPTHHPCVAVDLGCGGGRDAAFLALTLQQQHAYAPSSSNPVLLAVDNHRDALHRAAALAARAGLPATVEAETATATTPPHLQQKQHYQARSTTTATTATATMGNRGGAAGRVAVRCLNLDLRSPGAAAALEAAVANAAVAAATTTTTSNSSGGDSDGPRRRQRPWLVHAARFLERRLLRWLGSAQGAVAPGGWVVWSTFICGPQGSRNAVPPFRAGRLLGGKDELVSFFDAALYDIVHAAEGHLVTRGVATPAAFVVARRRKGDR